jgi:hypothetical protein
LAEVKILSKKEAISRGGNCIESITSPEEFVKNNMFKIIIIKHNYS